MSEKCHSVHGLHFSRRASPDQIRHSGITHRPLVAILEIAIIPSLAPIVA
jgi:hypothetical protein